MVTETCHTCVCTYVTKPYDHTPSELHPHKYILLSQTSSYGTPAVLRVLGDPPYHTVTWTLPHRPPSPDLLTVASAQTPAGCVLKSLPACFAQSNNFPKNPSNRQLDGGGEGVGVPEDLGRMLIKSPSWGWGWGTFPGLKIAFYKALPRSTWDGLSQHSSCGVVSGSGKC